MKQISQIDIPEFSLIMLVGISGSGKSSFAAKHFLPTEVVSSDVCRALISDDSNDQSVSSEAFELVRSIAAHRLKLGRLTVLDATHVQPGSRQSVLELAKQFDVLPIAIVLNPPLSICQERNQQRSDRQFGAHVLPNQHRQLRQSLKRLRKEGFRYVYEFDSVEALENLEIKRRPLWSNWRDQSGPFDIIGDVHGCCDELEELLLKLGYSQTGHLNYLPPAGRKALFLGDLVDRGPRNLDALTLAMNMVEAGHAICIPGNHEAKFERHLQGKKAKLNHGLEKTAAELDALPEAERAAFTQRALKFIDGLVSHGVLDQGQLVVAHAGMKEAYQGRASGRVRSFALFGETTGEIDAFGLPVRLNWAREYRGKAMVVYGHVPVPEPEWVNNTIDIDNGCVFGGKLTALRYPEKELVSVPARAVYYEPVKPLHSDHDSRSTQQQLDDQLDWAEVAGKQLIHTRLQHSVTIQFTQSAAALEIISRFAVDPKWLLYLPPTMSPSETSSLDDYLEYPSEALDYYRRQKVSQLICQAKHMGSRAVMVICKNAEVAQQRFGIAPKYGEAHQGCIYTRTGRPFFKDAATQDQLLTLCVQALTESGLFEELNSEWVILDAEIMPWSAKAGDLLQKQYAAVGAAASEHVSQLTQVLQAASARLPELDQALQKQTQRQEMIQQYIQAYRQYCWPVNSLSDLKIAPFHLLASEGRVHSDQNHLWHLEQLAKLSVVNPDLFVATDYRRVDLNDPASCQAAIDWWLALTAAGGEGMVVKPLDFIVKGPKGWAQPAIKCRGREYLRIIYGPDYTLPEHLTRLKQRGLSGKRSLALREFSLGIEGLERFVRYAPLRQVHVCAMGVLALESEPVDPRL